MTNTPRQILHLWDFGWCDHNTIIVPPIHKPSDMVQYYLNHDAFYSSFVGPNNDYTDDIHGPFWKSLISESDFEQINQEQFLFHIGAIRHPTEWETAVPHDQWDCALELACQIASRNTWCFRLVPNETCGDRFHDWGYVLDLFREFIFSNPNTKTIERLIFGYD